MLYQPTHAEIDAVVRHAIDKHPSLQGRWERAAALLAAVNANLLWTGDTWKCSSQANHRDLYPVDFHSCGCYDHQVAGAVVKGVPFCKHKLALLGYREIMGAQIAARAVGVYSGRADLRRLCLRPNGALLYSQNARPAWVMYAVDARDRIPTRLCIVRWTPLGNAPASESDLFVFSNWLEQATPVYESAPVGWDAATPEWQPMMSGAEFRRYLETGDVPALQV